MRTKERNNKEQDKDMDMDKAKYKDIIKRTMRTIRTRISHRHLAYLALLHEAEEPLLRVDICLGCRP